MGSLFMGIDVGTQSLKCSICDFDGNLIEEVNVHFDEEFPAYGTKGGVKTYENSRVTCPTMLWVEAIDLMFEQLKKKEKVLGKIVCICGGAQQHGSVYWKTGSKKALSSLDAKLTLKDQVLFAVDESPIWMAHGSVNRRNE